MDYLKKLGDLEEALKEILSRHDLSTADGRDAAFENCIEYAEINLVTDLRCNEFLRTAAKILEKEQVEFDVIRDMTDLPEDAKIDIAYDDQHGFMVTANTQGLQYLAELINLLAEAPEGEHIHFFNDEEPMVSISFNAVIYHEDSEWFKKAEDEANEEADQAPLRKRMIEPSEIFAVQFVGSLPHDIPIFRDRIYKVEKIRDDCPEYDEDGDSGIFRKQCTGDKRRYICIEIANDYGDDVVMIVHIDDPDVVYFKKTDLSHLF